MVPECLSFLCDCLHPKTTEPRRCKKKGYEPVSEVSGNLTHVAVCRFMRFREQTRLNRPSADEELFLSVDPHAGPRTLEILPYGKKDHKEISKSVSRGKFNLSRYSMKGLNYEEDPCTIRNKLDRKARFQSHHEKCKGGKKCRVSGISEYRRSRSNPRFELKVTPIENFTNDFDSDCPLLYSSSKSASTEESSLSSITPKRISFKVEIRNNSMYPLFITLDAIEKMEVISKMRNKSICHHDLICRKVEPGQSEILFDFSEEKWRCHLEKLKQRHFYCNKMCSPENRPSYKSIEFRNNPKNWTCLEYDLSTVKVIPQWNRRADDKNVANFSLLSDKKHFVLEDSVHLCDLEYLDVTNRPLMKMFEDLPS